jgi:broad specificity phosphatase PhoE
MTRTMPANPENTPARILLLRHAETAAPTLFHGAESDVALGDRGHEQARALAARLAARRPAAVYSSALTRAVQTAQPVAAAAGAPHRVVPALHERRMGPLSGVPREQGWAAYEAARSRWAAGDLDATHEGGESFAQIRDRILPAFRAIAGAHPGETVVVVAHGVVIRVLLISLLDTLTPADFAALPIDFCAVNELHFDGASWRRVAHEDDARDPGRDPEAWHR